MEGDAISLLGELPATTSSRTVALWRTVAARIMLQQFKSRGARGAGVSYARFLTWNTAATDAFACLHTLGFCARSKYR